MNIYSTLQLHSLFLYQIIGGYDFFTAHKLYCLLFPLYYYFKYLDLQSKHRQLTSLLWILNNSPARISMIYPQLTVFQCIEQNVYNDINYSQVVHLTWQWVRGAMFYTHTRASPAVALWLRLSLSSSLFPLGTSKTSPPWTKAGLRTLNKDLQQ